VKDKKCPKCVKQSLEIQERRKSKQAEKEEAKKENRNMA